MKVLIIGSNTAVLPYPVYPLGISVLATGLGRVGHQVEIFDLLQEGRDLTRLDQVVADFSPGVIGISIRNLDDVNIFTDPRYVDAVKGLVDWLRQLTAAPLVLGGSGFSLLPDTMLRAVGADYGVVGEGEGRFVELVAALERGQPPEAGILRSAPPGELSALPVTAYDPGLMSFYISQGGVAPVQTKRGCSCRCIYCSYPLLEGVRIRARDPETVVREMQQLAQEHGVKEVFFTDSVFNDDQGEHLALLTALERAGSRLPWSAYIKPRGLDDEVVELMKRTGLKAAEIGADATTDATLRGLGKGFSFDDVVRCNRLFLRHEIPTAHFVMFGGPGETQQTVLEGIAGIRALERTVSFIFMGLRILPDTPLARLARQQGLWSEVSELLEPVYYLAPGLERPWLEQALKQGFAGRADCVFPPNAMDRHLKRLHQRGHTGALWERLISG